MDCHGDNKREKGHQKHSSLKHMLHMILCCGLPIVIIGILPFISRFSPGAGRMLGIITPFMCPIMMIGMLPMMLSGSKKSSCCDNKDNANNKQPKLNKSVE